MIQNLGIFIRHSFSNLRFTLSSSTVLALAIFSLSTLFSVQSHASSKTPAKVIAGWIEKVVVEGHQVKAKLDTGAKTSSIYAENVTQFKKGKERWVRFTLALTDVKNKVHRVQLERPRSRRVKILNHDGDHDSRVSIDLDICFDGRIQSVEFTLADRNEYLYGVLLGRSFLNKRAIVDPSETFRTLASCPATRASVAS